MKLIKFLSLGVLILVVTQCREELPIKAADLVLLNGKVVTLDKHDPRAEALAIKGDTIIAVGSNKIIKKYIQKERTKVLDLQGKLVLPGFNDSHVHFVYGGYALMSVSLDGVTSFDEIQRRVKEKVKDKKEGEWIT